MTQSSQTNSPFRIFLKWVGLSFVSIFLLGCLVTGVTSGQQPPPAGKIILRFTVWDGDEALRILRAEVERFEAANPDIDVRLENFGDYALYHQKMLAQYAANVAPDVAMMDPPNFQRLAKRGALLPLNDFFDKTPGFNIKDYYDKIVEAHSFKGTVYVLPRDIAPMGLIYYNKEIFDELGIPYPDGTWTWDFKIRPELREKDFLWVAQQIAQKSGNRVERYGFASGWPQLWSTTMLYSMGKRWADDADSPTKILANDPDFIRVYEWLQQQEKMALTPSQVDVASLSTNQQQLFVGQKVGMFQSGIWEVPNMRRDLKPGQRGFFEWDIALAPGFAGNGGTKAAPTGGSGYAIFSSTKHPEAAWRLTQWMAGPPGMEAMARAGIAQPAIRSLALTEGLWLPGPGTPIEQQYPRNRIATDQAVQFAV
ncbi:MAG: sugar ABC transporter substrate-binding protein, partial [Fimbriimonadaceae bacterium]|nr:sugar ABC transporter substrate-binding protein [Fimbriimonadaceae bacterium]